MSVACRECGEPGEVHAGYGWCGVRGCPDDYAALCPECKDRIDLRREADRPQREANRRDAV